MKTPCSDHAEKGNYKRLFNLHTKKVRPASQHENQSALSLSDRDVCHSERGKDNWVRVRVGVGGGGEQLMLRVCEDRSGLCQDDVLRR